MTKTQAITAEVEKVPHNKLIFASQFYSRHFSEISTEELYYKTLERMCKSGELRKIAKGTYYRPKIGRYGELPPSESDIIKTFTNNETGTVVGYSLYNKLNLTTQIPKNIEVFSSQMEQQTKKIKNIHITQHNIKYSKQIESTVHMMEVLKNFSSIQDINYKAFISFCEKFSSTYCEEAVEYVLKNIKYQKRTISFLQTILSYYSISNHLEKYLSSLSEYNHPTMEAIYEAAHVS